MTEILQTRTFFFLLFNLLVNTGWGWAQSQPQSAGEWEEVSRSTDLVIYRKKMRDSSIFAYKGEALIKAPFARVLSVVMDTTRRTEWMERVSESKTLKTFNSAEKLDLMVTRVPWPLENRDFIFKSSLQLDPSHKKAILRLESQEHPDYPSQKKPIRGWIHNATFEMRETSDYTTQVIAESHIDPKGWVPAWIVNLVQKSFPRKTLVRLTEQSLKLDVKPFQF